MATTSPAQSVQSNLWRVVSVASSLCPNIQTYRYWHLLGVLRISDAQITLLFLGVKTTSATLVLLPS
ncbi:hypothetical protein [Thalassovita autumnalis]|uniref:hypothetical protein n=1 Tax=Thalassovita autumnalis TaxID=2072972 RepID=UPI0013F4E4C5|nr:hypothetical protein [Thalassovita autumnalis]